MQIIIKIWKNQFFDINLDIFPLYILDFYFFICFYKNNKNLNFFLFNYENKIYIIDYIFQYIFKFILLLKFFLIIFYKFYLISNSFIY